jgi:hypothetical protein
MQARRWASLAGVALCALLVVLGAAARPSFDPCCNVKLSDSRLGSLVVSLSLPNGYTGSSSSWTGPAWNAGAVKSHAALSWTSEVVNREPLATAAKGVLIHGWPVKQTGSFTVPDGKGKEAKAFYVITQAPPGVLGGQTEAALAVDPFAPCCNVVVRLSLLDPYGSSAVVGANKTPAATWNLQTALAVLKSVQLEPPSG